MVVTTKFYDSHAYGRDCRGDWDGFSRGPAPNSSSHPCVIVGFRTRNNSAASKFVSKSPAEGHSMPRSLLSEGLRSLSGVDPTTPCSDARIWSNEQHNSVPVDGTDRQISSSYDDDEEDYSDDDDSLSQSFSSMSSDWDGDFCTRPIDIPSMRKSAVRGNVAEMLRIVNERVTEDIERRQMAFFYAQKQCVSKQRARADRP